MFLNIISIRGYYIFYIYTYIHILMILHRNNEYEIRECSNEYL